MSTTVTKFVPIYAAAEKEFSKESAEQIRAALRAKKGFMLLTEPVEAGDITTIVLTREEWALIVEGPSIIEMLHPAIKPLLIVHDDTMHYEDEQLAYVDTSAYEAYEGSLEAK
jgi:hypothetical protein